jgi:hypothetical protein
MRFHYLVFTAAFLTFNIHEAYSQQTEYRMGINHTHLYQNDDYNEFVYHEDGLGGGIQVRFQKLHPSPLLKNIEFNLDLNRGNIYILEHRSPGGAGGNRMDAYYRALSLGVSNYFVNFGTLDKPFQIALGLSAQFKSYQFSKGYYTTQDIGWDTMRKMYTFSWTKHDMTGNRSDNYYRLGLGLCAGISFRPFHIGKQEFRTRYDFWLGLTSENRNGLNFGRMSQRLSLGLVINGNGTRYHQSQQIKLERKKMRKTAHADKMGAKPPIKDKPMEFGLGFNLYRFKVVGNDGTRSNIDPGFGFGFRIWDWPTTKKLPGVSLNFEQVNYQIWPYFLISTISGTFRRNTLSAGIYPLKWLLFKKRLDIRAGVDINFLLSNRAVGTFTEYDKISGLPIQQIQFKSDVLELHNYVNAGAVFTFALPLIRKPTYCLRWRNTFTYNLADMTVNREWGNGRRIQSELTFCWRWPASWNKP